MSGYYRWRRHGRRVVTDDDSATKKNMITEVFAGHKGNYGSPRILMHLRRQGVRISKKTVAKKYMRLLGLQSKCHTKKKYVQTTDSSDTSKKAENLLDRNFMPDRQAKVWCSDITYIHTRHRTVYLAIVLDIRTRKVIGYELSNSIDAILVCTALRQAIGYSRIGTKQTKEESCVLVHSDRGSQYGASMVRELLAAHHLKQSMSRKGNCWDNAVAESFFKTLKTETDILRKLPLGIEQLSMHIEEYIQL